MAGTIVDFFGYLSTDKTDAAKLASARRQCPFLGKQCTKPVAEDDAGGISGACAVAQIKDATPTICCPIRLYADDYKMLKIIAYKSFGVDLNLYSGKNKLALYKAKEEGGAVAVYGHDWGGELKLPKRDGVGNYFVDWILARLDGEGNLVEFTAIEVQTIDTTGNYRLSRLALFEPERRIVKSTVGLNWENVNKRIIPQIVYKGQVLQRERLNKTGLWFVTEPHPDCWTEEIQIR